MLQLVQATESEETPLETPPEKPLETPQWPRTRKITFTPDLDGKKKPAMIVFFPSPKVEDEFLSSIRKGAKKPIKDSNDHRKVIRLVDKNDKIIDKIEDFVK